MQFLIQKTLILVGRWRPARNLFGVGKNAHFSRLLPHLERCVKTGGLKPHGWLPEPRKPWLTNCARPGKTPTLQKRRQELSGHFPVVKL